MASLFSGLHSYGNMADVVSDDQSILMDVREGKKDIVFLNLLLLNTVITSFRPTYPPLQLAQCL